MKLAQISFWPVAGLTAGVGGAIELRLGVAATADHGKNVTGVRIQRDQRGLWLYTTIGVDFVETIHLPFQRLLGKLL
jgi:hypothetical protein